MTTRLLILGCLWYYGTSVTGERVELADFPPEVYVQHLTEGRSHQLHAHAPLPPKPDVSADFKVRSDHAATLIHKGDLKPAIEILEGIEKEKPGEYVVAVNLGTAYELAGDNETALRWIAEGLKRNATSHYGTEWLHVRILEAKIALAKDPGWLKKNSVLGLDFGDGLVPVLPSSWPAGKDADATLHALEYQLSERLAFVKPPDPLTGGLIADLGHLSVLKKTVEFGGPLYELAIRYQAPGAEFLEKRRAHLATIRHVDRSRLWIVLAALAAAALLSVAAIRFLRRA